MNLWKLLIVVILVTSLDKYIGHNVEIDKPKESRDTCIKDYLQDKLPDLSENKYLSKHKRVSFLKGIFSLDDILGLGVFMLFLWIDKMKHIKDIAIIYIFIRLFRLITMSITILPQPNKNCKPPEERNTLDRWFMGGCNDSIFSGHMSMMLVLLLYINKSVRSKTIKWLMLIFAISYSLLILMLRNHYSVDVILAWFISITTYIIYENKEYLLKKGIV